MPPHMSLQSSINTFFQWIFFLKPQKYRILKSLLSEIQYSYLFAKIIGKLRSVYVVRCFPYGCCLFVLLNKPKCPRMYPIGKKEKEKKATFTHFFLKLFQNLKILFGISPWDFKGGFAPESIYAIKKRKNAKKKKKKKKEKGLSNRNGQSSISLLLPVRIL